MDRNYKYELILKLIIINIIISILLFLINVILISLINGIISISQDLLFILYALLIGLEFIRIILLLFSVVIILKFEKINIWYKYTILLSLLIGTIINSWFLVRIFGFACFAPSYSFVTMLFIIASYILILFMQYENG